MGPNLKDRVSLEKGSLDSNTHRGRTPCEGEGGHQGNASTDQETLRIAPIHMLKAMDISS